MNVKKPWNDSQTPPTRAGFYEVQVEGDVFLILEYRRQGKTLSWYQHVSEDPTVEKKPEPFEAPILRWRNAERAAVEQALRRAPTEAELIQGALDSYRSHRGLYPARSIPVPDTRRLACGDEVIIGNLRNAVVVGLFENGEIVVIRHDKIPVRGEPATGSCYGAWHWTQVFKKNTVKWSESFSRPGRLHGAFSTRNLESLTRAFLEEGLEDSPDYQRGYVWEDADKQRYLDSLFFGRDPGRFILVRQGYPHPDVILDGKQRLKTIIDFVTSRLAWHGRYYHELSGKDVRHFADYPVQVALLDAARFSRADLLEIFLEVNAAGVPQSEAHLAQVRALLEEARQPKA